VTSSNKYTISITFSASNVTIPSPCKLQKDASCTFTYPLELDITSQPLLPGLTFKKRKGKVRHGNLVVVKKDTRHGLSDDVKLLD